MNDFISSVEAEAGQSVLDGDIWCPAADVAEKTGPPVEELVAHQFPGKGLEQVPDEGENVAPEEDLRGSPEQRLYRRRATTMLRRYMRYSLETGRLPNLLGREFFRSRVTQYRVTTFEDRVIFVLDMERCLQRLDDWSQQVLARIVLQEYEQEEAARLLGCARITVHRKLVEALDKLIEILLAVGLLEPVMVDCGNPCQEGEEGDFELSDGEQSEKKVEKHDTRTFAI